MKKKIISMALILVMILTVMPLNAFAFNETLVYEGVSQDYFWDMDNNQGYERFVFFDNLSEEYDGCFGNQLSGESRKFYDGLVKHYVDNRSYLNYDYTLTEDLTVQAQYDTINGKIIDSYGEIELVAQVISSIVLDAYYAFSYDYPQNFWFRNLTFSYSYNYSYKNTGAQIVDAEVTFTTVTFEPENIYENSPVDIATFDAAVDTLVSEFKAYFAEQGSEITREDKLRYIHDYICNNSDYDFASLEDDSDLAAHSAMPFFIGDKLHVCEGYAKSFKIICDRLGIPCVCVSGDAGEAHMWNYVQMEDGNWYLVDITWDDQVSNIDYTYFLANSTTVGFKDVSLSQERTESNIADGFCYPELSSTAYVSHTHSWGEYDVVKPATCMEPGEKQADCTTTLCDGFKSDIIPVDDNAHDWSNCDGSCVICNIECDHESFTDEVCDICGWHCDHTSVNVGQMSCGYCGRVIDLAEITVGKTVQVNDTIVYKFTPEYSGTYIISSATADENSDPCVELYEDNFYINTYDDCCDENDEIIDYNFNFVYDYKAGNTYYLAVVDLLCTYGFTVTVECVAHNWSEGKCLACGYICDHSEQTGKECEICGANLHTCDFTGEWKYDSEKHWKECTCGEIDEEAVHTLTEGKCYCGYECPHEETYETVTKLEHFSVQNPDGTWTKATVGVVCRKCYEILEEKEADRADYTEFDEIMAKICEYLDSGKLIDNAYNDYSSTINSIKNNPDIIGSPFQSTPDGYIEELNRMLSKIEAGIADGTMIKADFTYMTSLFDEINALIDNDPNKLIPSESGRFQGIYYGYYMSCKNNSNHSQFDYDQNMAGNNWEGQIEAILAGVKDGTALKADYTEIDEAIAILDEKLADVTLTDEAKAELEDIKAQLTEMKKDPLSSKADVEEVMKAVEELEKDVEDGSAVKVNGLEEIVNINDKLNNELAEKYGEEALAEIAEKLDEKFADKFDELYERAEALTGSVAENKDALDEIEAEMEAIFAEAENCLNGTHNGLKFEITEEAKCGENAIESATCTLCGETVTREVENSALRHSFTKYEVVDDPACGKIGKKVAVCDNGCGATDEKEIEALKHSFTKYEVVDAPACDVAGKEVAVCDNGCGATDKKEIEALKHSFTKYEVVDAPACDVAGKEVAVCDNGCGATDEKEIEALKHSFSKYIYNEDATCAADGTKTALCDNGCKITDTVTAKGTKLKHTDADGDFKCDNGCGYEFENPEVNKPDDPTKDCECNCHKSGFMGFIWKIVCFFWKLFKMNPVCECGVTHY